MMPRNAKVLSSAYSRDRDEAWAEDARCLRREIESAMGDAADSERDYLKEARESLTDSAHVSYNRKMRAVEIRVTIEIEGVDYNCMQRFRPDEFAASMSNDAAFLRHLAVRMAHGCMGAYLGR